MSPARDRILVADDNIRNVAILKKILGDDFEVITATDGEEALRLAHRYVPDVALLDITMPVINGYETCRRMRATPELARTKIIMVSAKAMVQERLEGYEAGADDYLVKPFDDEELRVKIRVYTRLKKVEEMDQLRSDLLMLLNQETRVPLASVLSPLEVALNDKTLSAETRKLVHMAQEGALQLHGFVEQVLFLSSLHSELAPLQFAPDDMGVIMADVVQSMGPAAEKAGIELVADPAVTIAVDVDAEQIRRVLTCLLDNAIRLSPPKGRVSVDLERKDGYGCISVSDHGPGVPAHFLPRVREGLTIPDANRPTPGHGLSLVIARAIARVHFGMLLAENLDTGGARFTLMLPVRDSAGQGEEGAAPRAEEARTR